MKKLMLSVLMLTFVAIGANAQAVNNNSADDRESAKHQAKIEAKMSKMSPEEKAKFQEKLAKKKAKWDAMTPEEKAAKMEKMKAKREEFKNMTPEERKIARAKRKEKHHKNG